MNIHFRGKSFELVAGETVLTALERQGMNVPSFCRSGVCHACVLEAKRGALPARSQKGLKESLKRRGCFLACVCEPDGDLEIDEVGASEPLGARVERVERLSESVLRVMIEAPAGFVYEAGQFVQLERPADGLMRPYSIASLPDSGLLELHVARLPGGAMSSWLATAAGESVRLRGPYGECMYYSDEPERPLLCAGTGTGLAPLLGVVRAAIAAGHRGPIRLYHGSPSVEGLYFWAELQQLLAQAPMLRLTGSVLSGARAEHGGRSEVVVTPLDELVLRDAGALAEQRIYLCGHPDLVRKLQRKLYLAGASLERIHADPFLAPAPAPEGR